MKKHICNWVCITNILRSPPPHVNPGKNRSHLMGFTSEQLRHFWNFEPDRGEKMLCLIWFIVFSATFSNISTISWRPVLEAGVPGENHRPWAINWLTLSLVAASHIICTIFCNLQSRAWTHAVLVISLYELLGNKTAYLNESPGPSKCCKFTSKCGG
jgi:hypothetical protein